jgi:NDP-sugar pyrophosphorylase family protein
MKAMIFAAGLGTRLKPLTDNLPKALVPIDGKPLLEHIILKLKKAGFDEIIVNVHHFPDQIINFLRANNNFGIRIEVSDERDLLLDTGGGIRKAEWFFNDGQPFLVHNVDIFSNVDLKELFQYHLRTDNLASLVVSQRNTNRYLLFDNNLRLKGWMNEKTGETKPEKFADISEFNKLAFAGIQVLSPSVFELMENLEPQFPIMDFYLSKAQSQVISGFVPDNFKMIDIGKLDILEEAEQFMAQSSESHSE